MIEITRIWKVWFLGRQQEVAFGAVGLEGPKGGNSLPELHTDSADNTLTKPVLTGILF